HWHICTLANYLQINQPRRPARPIGTLANLLIKKKPLRKLSGPDLNGQQIIFMEQPGYAIITEGFHDLSVDCMNTSFLFDE
ncbi:MAG TPA: hypothetical protein VK644_08260, partial [Chitinophagaceae bacterium]|nr:hypothetical protein [Chitinophagaceae bacterium]